MVLPKPDMNTTTGCLEPYFEYSTFLSLLTVTLRWI